MPGVSSLIRHFLRSLSLFLGNSELYLLILLGLCLLPEGAITAACNGVRQASCRQRGLWPGEKIPSCHEQSGL